MTGFILRRLLSSIPVILLSSFLVFSMVAATGDPLARLRGDPRAAQTVQIREEQLGLNDPIPTRYARWLKGVVQGDFGVSLIDAEPVTSKVKRSFGVTFRLVFLAAFLALVAAIVLGVFSAVKQYSPGDYAGTFFAFVFFSMPVFWLAGILKDLGIRFNQWVGNTVFYTVGERTPNLAGSWWDVTANRIGHIALPTLTLMLISMAGWSRFQRAAMLDVLGSDYVRTARAKGLSELAVIGRHAFRNALIPLTTVVAIDFAGLIGGAVITETVFAWQGLGRVVIDGIYEGDVTVVTAALVLIATVVVVFNLVADILYAVLDPRIRNA